MNLLAQIRRGFFVIVLALFVSSAYAHSYDQIIAFGDSLSDNGNLFRLTKELHENDPESYPIIPKAPPYFQGRFTNGPVWVELLQKKLNISMRNYAFGGSWAESFEESFPFLSGSYTPGLDAQVQMYLGDGDSNHSNHLYVILSGSNDYLGGYSRDTEYATSNTVRAVVDQMEILHSTGARHFLISNLPDFSFTPMAAHAGPEVAQKMQSMARMHNQKLAQAISRFRSTHTNTQVILADLDQEFTNMVFNPEKYNIKETRVMCYTGNVFDPVVPHFSSTSSQSAASFATAVQKLNEPVPLFHARSAQTEAEGINIKSTAPKNLVCNNPEEHLFWDYVHPTAKAHEALADFALKVLS